MEVARRGEVLGGERRADDLAVAVEQAALGLGGERKRGEAGHDGRVGEAKDRGDHDDGDE